MGHNALSTFLGLFDPEDAGTTFTRNVDKYIPVDTAYHPNTVVKTANFGEFEILKQWKGVFRRFADRASQYNLSN